MGDSRKGFFCKTDIRLSQYSIAVGRLASCKYYDNLPNSGSVNGRAFRDFSWEQRILDMSRQLGIGAQSL